MRNRGEYLVSYSTAYSRPKGYSEWMRVDYLNGEIVTAVRKGWTIYFQIFTNGIQTKYVYTDDFDSNPLALLIEFGTGIVQKPED